MSNPSSTVTSSSSDSCLTQWESYSPVNEADSSAAIESKPDSSSAANKSKSKKEVITVESLNLNNPNRKERRRIQLYLKQEHEHMKDYEPGPKRPFVCDVCLKPGHFGYRCPYVRLAKEDSPVAPGYMIVCYCCGREDAHPGDDTVRRRAVQMCCGLCDMDCDHRTSECPAPIRKAPLSLASPITPSSPKKKLPCT